MGDCKNKGDGNEDEEIQRAECLEVEGELYK